VQDVPLARHSEHDPAFYRTDEELAMWKSRDPLPTFTTYLRTRQVLTDDILLEIDQRVIARSTRPWHSPRTARIRIRRSRNGSVGVEH